MCVYLKKFIFLIFIAYIYVITFLTIQTHGLFAEWHYKLIFLSSGYYHIDCKIHGANGTSNRMALLSTTNKDAFELPSQYLGAVCEVSLKVRNRDEVVVLREMQFYDRRTNLSREAPDDEINSSWKKIPFGPIDGKWGDWGICDCGTRERNRSCDRPVPACGGKRCNGTSAIQCEPSTCAPAATGDTDGSETTQDENNNLSDAGVVGVVIGSILLLIIIIVIIAIYLIHRKRKERKEIDAEVKKLEDAISFDDIHHHGHTHTICSKDDVVEVNDQVNISVGCGSSVTAIPHNNIGITPGIEHTTIDDNNINAPHTLNNDDELVYDYATTEMVYVLTAMAANETDEAKMESQCDDSSETGDIAAISDQYDQQKHSSGGGGVASFPLENLPGLNQYDQLGSETLENDSRPDGIHTTDIGRLKVIHQEDNVLSSGTSKGSATYDNLGDTVSSETSLNQNHYDHVGGTIINAAAIENIQYDHLGGSDDVPDYPVRIDQSKSDDATEDIDKLYTKVQKKVRLRQSDT